MLGERVFALKTNFGIDLVDYGRDGRGILFSSGCGIGMALMDVLPAMRWFCDIDQYRHQAIDWECVGVVLGRANPEPLVLAGWFTIDRPTAFWNLRRGALNFPVEILTYSGGYDRLENLIGSAT